MMSHRIITKMMFEKKFHVLIQQPDTCWYYVGHGYHVSIEKTILLLGPKHNRTMRIVTRKNGSERYYACYNNLASVRKIIDKLH